MEQNKDNREKEKEGPNESGGGNTARKSKKAASMFVKHPWTIEEGALWSSFEPHLLLKVHENEQKKSIEVKPHTMLLIGKNMEQEKRIRSRITPLQVMKAQQHNIHAHNQNSNALFQNKLKDIK